MFGKPVKRDVQGRHVGWSTYTFKTEYAEYKQCSRIWTQAVTTTLNLNGGSISAIILGIYLAPVVSKNQEDDSMV